VNTNLVGMTTTVTNLYVLCEVRTLTPFVPFTELWVIFQIHTEKKEMVFIIGTERAHCEVQIEA
jgi:hypothetical protein